MKYLQAIGLVVLSGFVLWVVVSSSNKRDERAMVVYDGCYEVYSDNAISPEDYQAFMQNCIGQ